MKNNPARFVKEPNVQERWAENMYDYLLCMKRCFAIFFERNDVLHNL